VKELKRTEAKNQKLFKLQCSKYNEQLRELDGVRLGISKEITDKDKVLFIKRE